MSRLAFAFAAILALGLVTHAQDPLTGTWTGETRGGASLVLTVTVKDTTLTGTLTRDGQQTSITDGTVAKNTFSFKATLNGETESVSGELAGDTIKVWLDRQGPESAIVLRRAPAKSTR